MNSLFSLAGDQMKVLTELRATLPGAWRKPGLSDREARQLDAREHEAFMRTVRKGRGFRAAQETARHLRRSHGHAVHDARPVATAAEMLRVPYVRHCKCEKVPLLGGRVVTP
jgi:uncharacterized C2H2 Zn-finger protein